MGPRLARRIPAHRGATGNMGGNDAGGTNPPPILSYDDGHGSRYVGRAVSASTAGGSGGVKRPASPGGFSSESSRPDTPFATGHRASTTEARPRPPPSSTTTSRSEEHTSELQSLMRLPYAVFCF